LKHPPQADRRPALTSRITHRGWALLLVIFLLAGCTPAVGVSLPPSPSATLPGAIPPGLTGTVPTPTPLAIATTLPAPTASPTTDPIPTATASSTPPPTTRLCSPLADITLAELPEILANPFEQPGPGRDDGHHGADYAYYSRGSHTQMLGLPVLSALDGRIAAIINDRPPYGNMVIIETPLSALPPDWLDTLALPDPIHLRTDGRVTCPPLQGPITWVEGRRSLYLLYAHLNTPPPGAVGDPIGCGEPIGEVGTTGASVNPHLHLEVRIGPAEATFPVMAHYTNDATNDEMAFYCVWRFCGLFQPIDPALLLGVELK